MEEMSSSDSEGMLGSDSEGMSISDSEGTSNSNASEEQWEDDDDDYSDKDEKEEREEYETPVRLSNDEWIDYASIIWWEKKDYSKLFPGSSRNTLCIESPTGKNLLHECVKCDDLYIAKKLLKNFPYASYSLNGFLNKKDVNKATPLSMALSRPGSHEMVKFLLNYGASYTRDCVTDKTGKLRFGDKKNLKTFREYIGNTENFSKLARHLLTNDWKLEDAEALQDENLAYCAKLISAVNKGNVKQVESMLTDSAHLDGHITRIFYEIVALNRPDSIFYMKLYLKQCGLRLKSKINSDYSYHSYLLKNIDSALLILDYCPGIQLTDNFFRRITSYNNRKISFGDLLLETGYLKIRSIDDLLFQFIGDASKTFLTPSAAPSLVRFKARLYDLGCGECKEKNLKYFDECNEEIEKMKKKIYESRTVYDIFIKSIDDMVYCTSNDKLMKSIRSNITEVEFPQFIDVLKLKLEKARRKREWIEQSIDVLCSFFPPEFRGNRLVVEKIVYYLGFPNMLNLVGCYFSSY